MLRTHILAAWLVLVFAAAPVAAAEPIRFRTPIAYGTHLPGFGKPIRAFADLARALSGGALEFELSLPGEAVMPHEILDAVSSGKAEAGISKADFWAGRLPAAPLFSGYPFGPDATLYAAWFYGGNGLKLYQRMYDDAGLNVHVEPCIFAGAETAGWYAKEVATPDDLNGLRIRIFGQGALVMRSLGANPVILRGGKIADAFASGEIEAAELYTPPVDAETRENLASVAKHIYLPGWHQPETVLELLVNKDRWDALSDRQQLWIRTACKANLMETMARNAVESRAALRRFAEQGAEVEALPQPVMDALRHGWDMIAAEEAQRDPFFAEVIADLRRFREEHRQDRPAAPLVASSGEDNGPAADPSMTGSITQSPLPPPQDR